MAEEKKSNKVVEFGKKLVNNRVFVFIGGIAIGVLADMGVHWLVDNSDEVDALPDESSDVEEPF